MRDDRGLEALTTASDAGLGFEARVLVAARKRYGVELDERWLPRVEELAAEYRMPQRRDHQVMALADLLTLNALLAGEVPYSRVGSTEYRLSPDTAHLLLPQNAQRSGMLKELYSRIGSRGGMTWKSVVTSLGESSLVIAAHGKPIRYHGRGASDGEGRSMPDPEGPKGIDALPADGRQQYDEIRRLFPRIKAEVGAALGQVDTSVGVRGVAFVDGGYRVTLGSETGLYWVAQTRAGISEKFDAWLRMHESCLPSMVDGWEVAFEPMYPAGLGLTKKDTDQVTVLTRRALREELRGTGIRVRVSASYSGYVAVSLDLPDEVFAEVEHLEPLDAIDHLCHSYGLPRRVPAKHFSHLTLRYSVADLEARSQTI